MFVYELGGSSKEFLDIQATILCGFTLKRVRDVTRTYSHKLYCFLFSGREAVIHLELISKIICRIPFEGVRLDFLD